MFEKLDQYFSKYANAADLFLLNHYEKKAKKANSRLDIIKSYCRYKK